MAARSPALIVRHDVETGLPLRDAEGRCIPVGLDEPGELLGRLASRPEHRFEGYTDTRETERKVLRDVLEPGDRWMRTGDLMRRDAQGFYYFVDRIGDTFRWKGENVATPKWRTRSPAARAWSRRASTASPCRVRREKPAMAAIKVEGDLDLAGIAAVLDRALPAYARPLFLRVVESFESTETFKQKKGGLAGEGFRSGPDRRSALRGGGRSLPVAHARDPRRHPVREAAPLGHLASG